MECLWLRSSQWWSAKLGSNQVCSSGAESKATASNITDLESVAIHEDNSKPQGKKLNHVNDDDVPLTKKEEYVVIGFFVSSLAGYVYGGYAAACYWKPLVLGPILYAGLFLYSFIFW